MDLRNYKPGDKFITRSGQTVTLQAFHPDKSTFYQVRFTREPTWNSHKLHFYTSLSGREVEVFESAEDIIKPAPVEYKFGDLVRLVSGKLALCVDGGGNGSGIVIVQQGGTGLKWISTKDIQERLSSHPEVPRTYETKITIVTRTTGTLMGVTQAANDTKNAVKAYTGGDVTLDIKEV